MTYKYSQKTPIHELRLAAILKMGSACRMCGYSDARALEMDHIESLMKTGEKRLPTKQTYLEIINAKFPAEKYQLLCANCHRIKSYEHGDSLHKSRGEALKGGFSCVPEEKKRVTRGMRNKLRISPLSNSFWVTKLNVSLPTVIYLRHEHEL